MYDLAALEGSSASGTAISAAFAPTLDGVKIGPRKLEDCFSL
jgi:hypothetical protein